MTTEGDMSAVFHALAHESRRKIMDVVKAAPGVSVGKLAAEFDVTRISVMNHLAVLEDAGLIVSEREGRTRRLYLNAAPIQMINDRWLSDYSAQWARKLLDIKYAAEAAAKKPRKQGKT